MAVQIDGLNERIASEVILYKLVQGDDPLWICMNMATVLAIFGTLENAAMWKGIAVLIDTNLEDGTTRLLP